MQNVLDLRKLVSSIKPLETIIVTSINQSSLTFDIKSTTPQKSKSYLISFSNTSRSSIDKAVQILMGCRSHKFKVTHQNIGFYEQLPSQLKLQQIVIPSLFEEKQLRRIARINVSKIIFQQVLPFDSIGNLYEIIRQPNSSKSITVQFYSANYQLQQVIRLLSQWLYLSLSAFFEFQRLDIVTPHEDLILFFERTKEYGYNFNFLQVQLPDVYIVHILELLININHPFSIQFSSWKPSHIESLKLLTNHLEIQQRYLVKFGRYIEVTNYQFVINTAGMQPTEIEVIYDIFKRPGHYQIICHSSIEHFGYAVALFIDKPIIKLRYLVPHFQYEEIEEAVGIMESKAENLKKRVNCFMSMVNGKEKIDMNLALRLYSRLPKTSPCQ